MQLVMEATSSQCNVRLDEYLQQVKPYETTLLTFQYLDPNAILVVLAFITSGVGGSTKKLAFGASYQLGYAVGNICGPQTFRADEAPHYYVRFCFPQPLLLPSLI